jgi:hypothetical protein
MSEQDLAIIDINNIALRDNYILYVKLKSDPNQEDESFAAIYNAKVIGVNKYRYRNQEKQYYTISSVTPDQDLTQSVFDKIDLKKIVFTQDMYDRNWFLTKDLS